VARKVDLQKAKKTKKIDFSIGNDKKKVDLKRKKTEKNLVSFRD